MKARGSKRSLDGFTRRCLKFKRVTISKGQGKGRSALRCVRFAKRAGMPACHKAKKGGGRSKGLLNHSHC